MRIAGIYTASGEPVRRRRRSDRTSASPFRSGRGTRRSSRSPRASSRSSGLVGRTSHVEHVGSTSVPGLPGKGIVDLATETSPDAIPGIVDAMYELGFGPQPGPDPWPPTRPMLVGSYALDGRRVPDPLPRPAGRRRLRARPPVPRRAPRRPGARRRVRSRQGRDRRRRPTGRSTASSTRTRRGRGSSRRTIGSGSGGRSRRPRVARRSVSERGALVSQVGIIVGSRSDIEVAQRAAAVLDELGVEAEIRVISAHRAPDLLGRFVAERAGAGDRRVHRDRRARRAPPGRRGVADDAAGDRRRDARRRRGRARRAARDRPDAEGRAGRGRRGRQRRERRAARGADPRGRRTRRWGAGWWSGGRPRRRRSPTTRRTRGSEPRSLPPSSTGSPDPVARRRPRPFRTQRFAASTSTSSPNVFQSRARSSPSADRPRIARGPFFRMTVASGCAWRLSHHAGSPLLQPFIARV